MPDAGCEFPKQNATTAEVTDILAGTKSIAVVGISPKAERPSHWITQFLLERGYTVVGVNPGHSEILGVKVYPSLADVPDEIDLVDIFLRPENIPPVVDQAIAKKVKAVWMQEGIVNNAAADKARAAGIKVVMNKCIYKELSAR